MERKKITFDSFIRGVILGVIIIGILMLCFLYLLMTDFLLVGLDGLLIALSA